MMWGIHERPTLVCSVVTTAPSTALLVNINWTHICHQDRKWGVISPAGRRQQFKSDIVCNFSPHSLKWKCVYNILFVLPTGKFQMQVLPQCGHAVHEDAPDKVSNQQKHNRFWPFGFSIPYYTIWLMPLEVVNRCRRFCCSSDLH